MFLVRHRGSLMQERLATEHSGELFRDTLEQLLDGGRVADESGRHLQALRRNITDGGLDVVRDPFNEVATILVLNRKHLLIDLLHGHTATEHGSHRQVAAMTRITSRHHILRIEHLLRQFWHSQCTVLL
uniref:Uncharacterized protein n=1 Tax=Anopheles culicifacies TaxID=139723 RepID=A0A182MEH8_9DIPT